MTEKICPNGHVVGSNEEVCSRDGISPVRLENPAESWENHDPQINAPEAGVVVPFKDLKVAELQKIARDAGVKANQPKAKLVAALKRKLKVEGVVK